MNLWTLGASVQGHCEYLKERFPGVEPLHVVLAYDVRQFEDQRQQLQPRPAQSGPAPVVQSVRPACRRRVRRQRHSRPRAVRRSGQRYLATPELSFIIRKLSAHGGLNISASHNPPDDNGGKFYDERGGQPVPPDDQIMADLVDQVAEIKNFAVAADAVRAGRVHFLDESRTRPTSSCAASRAWSSRRDTTMNVRSSSRRCTASAR